MSIDKKEINKSVICLLKKEENSISLDFLPITNSHVNEYQKFMSMVTLAQSQGQYSSDLILGEIKKSDELKNIFTIQNPHCQNISLSAPHQYFNSIEETELKISLISSELTAEEAEKKKLDYLLELISYYNRVQALDSAIINSKSDNKVIAYSHRIIGWRTQEYVFDKNFKFCCNTNFGFGGSSYFHLVLVYKNIYIIPYSEWIFYRYANAHSILRYTRNFPTDDAEWKSAFEFAENSINEYLRDERTFVEKYIVEEVEKMVGGLEKILVDTKFVFHNSSQELQSRELINFRGEKISGATEFIQSLLTLNEIVDVKKYISRIGQCCRSIKPIIEKELELITKELEYIKLLLEHAKLKETNAEQKLQEIIFGDEMKSLFDNLSKENPRQFILDVREALLLYKPFETEYEELKSNADDSKQELWKIQRDEYLLLEYQERFNGYIPKLEAYCNLN